MFKRVNSDVVPFSINSPAGNRYAFGTTDVSNDIDVNYNENIKKGFGTGPNEFPELEDFNALMFTGSYLAAYLYQAGIPEWNDKQKYYINSIVMGSDGNLYKSLTGTEETPNIGNNPTLAGSVSWKSISSDCVKLTGNQTIAGVKTFSSSPIVPTPTTGTQAVNKVYVDGQIASKTAEVVKTIADLKTITGTNAEVLGYYTAGDGGGGLFYWDSISTETDNGGTIIQATGVTTGRWKRIYSGAINVKWFGAVGDGATDDAVAIQRALNVTGAILFDRNKIYKTSQQLRISSNTILDLNLSKIRRDYNTSPTGAGLMGFVSNGVHNLIIKNGILDVNGVNYKAASANAFTGATGSNITIQNVTFLDVVDYHAIDLADVKNVVIDNCKFLGQIQTGTSNDKEAIQLDPGYSLAAGYGVIDNFVVSNCIFGENIESGTPAYCTGVGNHSLNIDGGAVTNVKITGCIFKGMTYTAIRCYAFDNTLIANNTFKGCKQDIILNVGIGTSTLGCDNTTIVNNIFDSALTALSSSSVRLDGDSNIITNTIIKNNTFNVNGVVLRADSVNGILFSNNYIKGASNVCNILNVKDVVISDNIVIECTNTNIYLTEECKNIKISGNLSKKSLGRFLHCTGPGAENRENITVVNNTQIDGARQFCAFDSGGTSGVTVANNTISTGDDNIIPAELTIIVVGVTGLSNYMSNNNISKDIMESPGRKWSAGFGCIATNEKVYGSPEGVINAGVGSMVTRTDGGIGTTLYIKESGTGNVGWVAK